MTNDAEEAKIIRRQVKMLGSVSLDHLSCRRGATGHLWHLVQPDWTPDSSGVIALAKQCQRCFAIMRVNVSKRFGEYLDNPRYQYPRGYLIKRDPNMPPIRTSSVRAAFLDRVSNELDDLPMMVVFDDE